MISGVVAQELPPLPRGLFKPVRLFVDADALSSRSFRPIWISFCLSAPVSSTSTNSSVHDMPTMLTVEALWEAWQDGEAVPTPRVTQSKQLIASFYSSADVVFGARCPHSRLPDAGDWSLMRTRSSPPR